MNKEKKNKVAILCLTLGMFFNPFGYDVLFKMVQDLTGDYWTTVRVFYCLAGLFFGLYFYYSGTNPFLSILVYANSKKEWVKKKISNGRTTKAKNRNNR